MAIEHRPPVVIEDRPGVTQAGSRSHPFLFHRRQGACKHRLGNQGQRNAELQGVDCCPATGALLSGRIQDVVDACAAIRLGDLQDLGGDLDEIRRQWTLVPAREDRCDLLRRHAQAVAHQLPGLGDQLHVTVFDAVVDHLHVVAGTTIPDPAAAGLAVVRPGGDALEHVADQRPGRGIATGHDGGPVPGAFLAAGDPDAEKADTLCCQFLPAPLTVFEKRVSAVDDDVARFQVWQQTFDDQIDHLPGGRHQKYGAWPGQRGRQPGKIVTGHDGRVGGELGDEIIGNAGGSVVDRDPESVVGHIEGDVAAHDAEAVNGDIGWHSCVPLIATEAARCARVQYRQTSCTL